MSTLETGTARLSFCELDLESAAALRQLHQRDPRWNWICALYPSLWLLSAWLMNLYPIWPVEVAGVIVIAVSIQAMAILMHEALHRNLFRRSSPDRWAAFLLAIPAFFSGTAYKIAHVNHHKHTRTSLDQDEISNFCRSSEQYRVLFYVYFAAGTFLYFFIVPWKALSIASAAERHRILGEYSAMFGVYAALIATAVFFGRGSWLLIYWLIPAQFAMLLSNVRMLAEHLCTERASVISRTRTTTSNGLVSFLMCNLNYHLEHHLFPGIPWYNLRKAHRILMPIYSKTGVAHIERSYVRYALRAFRGGPFHEIRGDLSIDA